MKIEQYLEIGISSPADGLIQDIQLPLDVGVAIQGCNGPVPDRDTNMVEAIVANFGEVIFGDPGVPVVLQSGRCSGLAEGLSVRVLVDDGVARGPWLEDGGCDPWLEDEPAAQVDATDLVVLVVEGYITLAQATVDRSVRFLEQRRRVTHKVRGADCTVALSKEMAMADSWRKLLLNMVIAVMQGEMFAFGRCKLGDQLLAWR